MAKSYILAKKIYQKYLMFNRYLCVYLSASHSSKNATKYSDWTNFPKLFSNSFKNFNLYSTSVIERSQEISRVPNAITVQWKFWFGDLN